MSCLMQTRRCYQATCVHGHTLKMKAESRCLTGSRRTAKFLAAMPSHQDTQPPPPRSTFNPPPLAPTSPLLRPDHGRHERATQLFPHPDLDYVGKHEHHYRGVEVTGELGIADSSFRGKITSLDPGSQFEQIIPLLDGRLPPGDQDFIMANFYATKVGRHLKAAQYGARLG